MQREAGRWQEWVITLCLVAISACAVWTVFGEDLASLLGRP
jgi:hypothetical protein